MRDRMAGLMHANARELIEVAPAAAVGIKSINHVTQNFWTRGFLACLDLLPQPSGLHIWPKRFASAAYFGFVAHVMNDDQPAVERGNDPTSVNPFANQDFVKAQTIRQ